RTPAPRAARPEPPTRTAGRTRPPAHRWLWIGSPPERSNRSGSARRAAPASATRLLPIGTTKTNRLTWSRPEKILDKRVSARHDQLSALNAAAYRPRRRFFAY